MGYTHLDKISTVSINSRSGASISQTFICNHAVVKAFHEATPREVDLALRYLKFTIMDGHQEIALPKTHEGVPISQSNLATHDMYLVHVDIVLLCV